MSSHYTVNGELVNPFNRSKAFEVLLDTVCNLEYIVLSFLYNLYACNDIHYSKNKSKKEKIKKKKEKKDKNKDSFSPLLPLYHKGINICTWG